MNSRSLSSVRTLSKSCTWSCTVVPTLVTSPVSGISQSQHTSLTLSVRRPAEFWLFTPSLSSGPTDLEEVVLERDSTRLDEGARSRPEGEQCVPLRRRLLFTLCLEFQPRG